MMPLRQRITAAALLGTSKQPFELTSGDPTLQSLLSQLNDREPAQRLLDAIALVSTYEECGGLPPRPSIERPPPAQEDPRPQCSSTAAAHLNSILEERPNLLQEWLEILAQTGKRPPNELIPALLDAAAKECSIRTLASAAAGPLGVWLARFRSDWTWIHGSMLNEALWHEGTPAERIAVLKLQRKADAAKSREWIAATWSTEAADFKKQIVEAIAEAKTPADEDFLESALDDRSVVVRRAAAEQLAGLPGSKLSQRMADRLIGRLSIAKEGFFGQKKILNVDPFAELDTAMVRDGIEKKPTRTDIGERAWWTMQAIAAVDPNQWAQQFGLEPTALIRAAINGQWKDPLLDGFAAAAIRRKDVRWLHALSETGELPALAFDLLQAMPTAPRELSLIKLIEKAPETWILRAPTVCTEPWSKALTDLFLRGVLAIRDNQAIYYIRPAIRAAATLAHIDTSAPLTDEVFAEFEEILNFRRSMRQALLGTSL